jgi:hypothetical protein
VACKCGMWWSSIRVQHLNPQVTPELQNILWCSPDRLTDNVLPQGGGILNLQLARA